MKSVFFAVVLALVAAQTHAFDPESVGVYTLYRSSSATGMRDARMHIATFDAAESVEYNRGNCLIAAQLFQKQPGVIVRYWCEAGRYRKSAR